jgi:hypothetical protein
VPTGKQWLIAFPRAVLVGTRPLRTAEDVGDGPRNATVAARTSDQAEGASLLCDERSN